MDWTDKDANVIKMLFKHEITLSHLYDEYAKRFPDHEKFWSRLSEEETEHALLISRLFRKLEDGSVNYDGKEFEVHELQEAIRRVSDLLAEVKKSPLPFITALAKAWTIEKSMIEKRVFHVFHGNSPDFSQILLILEEETEDHLARIQRLYKDIKKTSEAESQLKGSKHRPGANLSQGNPASSIPH